MTDQNQQSLFLGKIAAYTEILVKDPGSTIFVSLAETYRKMGMLDDARQIISKGLDLHPDFSPAHIVLARVLCQLEDFDGSVTAFERSLELDEESLAALVGYARVQILLGDEVVARELLLKARHLTPADPVINKLLLSLPEDIEIVDRQSDEATGLNDESTGDTVELVSPTLAELYLSQGLSEKALDIFQQLSLQNPDDLTLRRRVKELESQLSVATSVVTEEELDLPSNQQEDKSSIAEEIVVESAADSVETQVLDTLNLWLANINQRRGNV